MKSPLRVGAVAAPKRQFPLKPGRLLSGKARLNGKARRIASLSGATAVVLSVAAASALFVDYLADRALARAGDDPAAAKPVVVAAVETAAEAKVASIATSAPVVAKTPAAAPIEAALPEPDAIARVAVGPEHAIELPTGDPTAKPVVKLAAVAPENDEPLAFADDASDDTRTAAIAPDEAQAAPKPKRNAAKTAPADTRDTDVSSLPGVDVGGLAGHPSSQSDEPESTVRTVTKPAQAASRNLGGVPAGAARVTAAVNMRSAPRKGSSVLTVVPAGSAVNVLSCNGWCQIDYNGRKGFIYKTYLAASKARPRKQDETAEASEPARGIRSPRLN